MLTLLIPKDIGPAASPVKFEAGSEIDEIELQLRVWQEGDVTKFIYSPAGSAAFFTNSSTQTLTVTMKSQLYDDNGVDKVRFVIIGHSTKNKKLIQSVKHRKKGSQFTATDPPHTFPIGPDTDAVKFTLNLKKDRDDTYINIIIRDMTDGSIIDCDPQAENGTKT